MYRSTVSPVSIAMRFNSLQNSIIVVVIIVVVVADVVVIIMTFYLLNLK